MLRKASVPVSTAQSPRKDISRAATAGPSTATRVENPSGYMTARSGELLDRHVYAVDGAGTLTQKSTRASFGGMVLRYEPKR